MTLHHQEEGGIGAKRNRERQGLVRKNHLSSDSNKVPGCVGAAQERKVDERDGRAVRRRVARGRGWDRREKETGVGLRKVEADKDSDSDCEITPPNVWGAGGGINGGEEKGGGEAMVATDEVQVPGGESRSTLLDDVAEGNADVASRKDTDGKHGNDVDDTEGELADELARLYDEDERMDLWGKVERKRAVERHRESRGGGGSVATTKMGRSLCDWHPGRVGEGRGEGSGNTGWGEGTMSGILLGSEIKIPIRTWY